MREVGEVTVSAQFAELGRQARDTFFYTLLLFICRADLNALNLRPLVINVQISFLILLGFFPQVNWWRQFKGGDECQTE